jgi:hypothetical protein
VSPYMLMPVASRDQVSPTVEPRDELPPSHFHPSRWSGRLPQANYLRDTLIATFVTFCMQRVHDTDVSGDILARELLPLTRATHAFGGGRTNLLAHAAFPPITDLLRSGYWRWPLPRAMRMRAMGARRSLCSKFHAVR